MEEDSRGIRSDLVERCRQRLTMLKQARGIEEFRIPGWRFHRLHGKPVRYPIHVNGPSCTTFEWEEGDAWAVDLEQYH
jgi:proteic killer suppression protein